MSRHGDKPRSRRELLTGDRTGSVTASERPVLAKLLEFEGLAQRVYDLSARSAHLTPAGQTLARRVGAQERAHAAALAALLGESAPTAAALSVQATEAALGREGIKVTFSMLRSEQAWFTLLERLENHLEGAYYSSLMHLASAASVTLAAKILACEAQHATMLFSFRHPQDIDLDVAVGLVTGNVRPPAVASGSS